MSTVDVRSPDDTVVDDVGAADRWSALARHRWLLPVMILAVALVIAGALVSIAGASPIEGLIAWGRGAVGSRYHLGETLVRAVPLALVALTVAPGLRAGVINIGAEGQLAMGALAATATALALGAAHPVIALGLPAVAGVVAGAAWAAPAAWLRTRVGVSEILTTLLANFVAVDVLAWTLRRHLNAPGVATPQSPTLDAAGRLPILLANTRLHWGLVAVPITAVLLWWWLRSRHGLAHTVFAWRPLLARRMGVRPARVVLGTLLIAGAGAGFTGWLQVAGPQGRLYPTVTGGLGFTALLVATLGGLRPVGIIVGSLILASLQTGAEQIQTELGVPSAVSQIIEAVLLASVAVVAAIRLRSVQRQQVDETPRSRGTT